MPTTEERRAADRERARQFRLKNPNYRKEWEAANREYRNEYRRAWREQRKARAEAAKREQTKKRLAAIGVTEAKCKMMVQS